MRIATTLPFTEKPVAPGNFDTTRKPIDKIVIHTMVGTTASAAARFNTEGTQVSAHYGVSLDGSLTHWLEETYTAYHAGNYEVNQTSIGIEHEDGGMYNSPRPDALYTASSKLVADICHYYNIPIDSAHILPHHNFYNTACPDSLDIERIIRGAAAIKPSITIEGQVFEDLVNKASKYDQFVDRGFDSVDKLSTYLTQADNSATTIAQLNQELDNRKEQIQRLSDEIIAKEQLAKSEQDMMQKVTDAFEQFKLEANTKYNELTGKYEECMATKGMCMNQIITNKTPQLQPPPVSLKQRLQYIWNHLWIIKW